MAHQYSVTPTIRFNRSALDLNHGHKTTMNVGDLVPVYLEEVLPGDTFKMTASFISRLTSSFIKVPLDNLYLDLNFFFVPNRIIWKKWVNLMGENTGGFWTNINPPNVPRIAFRPVDLPTSKKFVQSLPDYLGIPVTGKNSSKYYSQLPFRAFAKIWNDWYRNENTQAPVLINEDKDTDTFVDGADEWSPRNIYGQCPKVSKFHDMFTSALPAPQKGDAPASPLHPDVVPVLSLSEHSLKPGMNQTLKFRKTADGSIPPAGTITVDPITASANIQESPSVRNGGLYVSNLWADLSAATGATANELRILFATQRLLEEDARFGTRYTEVLEGHFGVMNPDARLQRSEYLGGFRTPLQFQPVAQTSQGSPESPQANLSAYSHSGGVGGFSKSFSEYGYIIGVACIRQKHTYSQGIDKLWTRRVRTDFYDPVFANIGEQPIYTSQLFADADPSQIFGYQEAWVEYREHPNRVSGYMRPSIEQSLAVWNFADNYENAPSLNSDFLNETSEFVDRTLSVPSSSTPNFLLDFDFRVRATRVMPLYSTPKLIDHVGRE